MRRRGEQHIEATLLAPPSLDNDPVAQTIAQCPLASPFSTSLPSATSRSPQFPGHSGTIHVSLKQPESVLSKQQNDSDGDPTRYYRRWSPIGKHDAPTSSPTKEMSLPSSPVGKRRPCGVNKAPTLPNTSWAPRAAQRLWVTNSRTSGFTLRN